jgi:hypothetical protein
MRLRSCFSAFLLAICFANELRAQTTTSGGVTGVVTDQSLAVLPNADVEIRDINKGTTESTKTDRYGVYRFFFLSPSQYTLTVVHDGFRKESRSVTVLLGTPVTVNITLEIAKANMQLVVTAEAPLVEADNGDVSITMSQKQISELPDPGNDLTYIAQTAPGAIMNTDNALTGGGGGNFSILGMPGTSNLFTLNGMNDNLGHLNFTGATGMLLGQNQIQEATVVSNGYSGHFGDAAGSYVNYVTKSGGNAFHGNAEYFWNGSVLNATDWITKDYTYNAVGDIGPQTIDAFYSGGVDPASPRSDSTRLRQSFPTQLAQRFASYTLAGYGQDEWHVKSNLTLTLALRVEHQSNPVRAHDCFAELTGPFESISHDPAQPYNQAISKRKQAFFPQGCCCLGAAIQFRLATAGSFA